MPIRETARIPKLTPDTTVVAYLRQLTTCCRQQGLESFLDVANKPDPATRPERLPVCETAAEIIVHVRPKPALRALIPGLNHNTAEAPIDSDMRAVYREAQLARAEEIKDFDAAVKAWPIKRARIFGIIEEGIEGFEDARKAVAQAANGDVTIALDILQRR